jgi:hypothetical protein
MLRLMQLRRQAVLLLLLSSLLAACGGTTLSPSAAPPTAGQAGTTVVRRGDIEAVLTLSGDVVARPTFGVTAARAGSIHLSSVPTELSNQPIEIARVGEGTDAASVSLPAFAGFLGWLIHDGDPVTSGLPVASAYYSGFAVEATIPTSELYRFYGSVGAMQAQISHGPGPFACPQLGNLGASGQPVVDNRVGPTDQPGSTSTNEPMGQVLPGPGTGSIVLLCAAPRDLTLFAGMPAILAVSTAQAHDVMILPVEAVAGSSQRGRVTLIKPDGSKEAREVQLGITDGTIIQIKSGLNVGDVVAVPGPFLGPGLNP